MVFTGRDSGSTVVQAIMQLLVTARTFEEERFNQAMKVLGRTIHHIDQGENQVRVTTKDGRKLTIKFELEVY